MEDTLHPQLTLKFDDLTINQTPSVSSSEESIDSSDVNSPSPALDSSTVPAAILPKSPTPSSEGSNVETNQEEKTGESGEGEKDDEEQDKYTGQYIDVTAVGDSAVKTLEIRYTFSGSTAGCFRVRHVDETKADKSQLINGGKNFILKVYAPELAHAWETQYGYTLSPELKQEFQMSVVDGRYQNFVNSMQNEFPELAESTNFPADTTLAQI